MNVERNEISGRMQAAAAGWKAEAFRALELDTAREVQKIFGRCQSKIAAAKLAMSLVETLIEDGNAPLAYDVVWEFSQNVLDKKDPQKLQFLERMIQLCLNEQQDTKAYGLLTEAVETASLQNKPDEARRFSSMTCHLEIM